MKRIHLIMPMAGGGTRFLGSGNDMPKPMILLQGKPFFYWAVRSIEKFVEVEDITFVVLKEHVDKYKIDESIKSFIPNAIIVIIPKVLNGAVLTCCEGVKEIKDNLPILFNDCDHAFISESFNTYVNNANFDSIDGAVLTFHSNCPNYSYVAFDEESNIIGTIEKVVVSEEAICGAYYFKNKSVFKNAVNSYLENCQYQEFFVSGLYNELARQKAKLCTFNVDEHISFGTPEEYKNAEEDDRLRVLI